MPQHRATAAKLDESSAAIHGGDDLDISPQTAAWIRQFHDSLEQTDFFELLGADHQDGPIALRRAYRARCKQFHPDRYFRKRLGPYKPMLERIFTWLSYGFRLLTDEKRRADYLQHLYQGGRRSNELQRSVSGVIALPGASLDFVIGDDDDSAPPEESSPHREDPASSNGPASDLEFVIG